MQKKIGRGRPRKEIDVERLKTLAMIGAPIKDIAAAVGCCERILYDHFIDVINEARSNGRLQILGKAYKSALAGNPKILALVLVNLCGWQMRPSQVVNISQSFSQPTAETKSPEETKRLLVELQMAVRAEAKRLEAEQPKLPGS